VEFRSKLSDDGRTVVLPVEEISVTCTSLARLSVVTTADDPDSVCAIWTAACGVADVAVTLTD